jgi:hypothetical protein
MGILDFFRRSPRHFQVVVGEPWTINGQPTQGDKPEEVLAEIYDIAVYFPITITVEASSQTFQIEMDEYGKTRPLESVSEEASQDVHHTSSDDFSQVTDVATEADIAADMPDDSPRDTQPALRGFRLAIDKLRTLPRKAVIVLVTLSAIAVISTVAWPIVFGGNVGNEVQTISSGEGENWQTAIPETSTANQPLDAQFKNKLWSIEPGDASSASWFKAGIVTTNNDTIELLDHQTGERITSHAVPKGVNLNDDLQWVAEFYHEDTPAVGLKVGETFIAVTSKGEAQEWQIPDHAEITVYGTTPLLHSGPQDQDQNDLTYCALIFGEEEPVELTVNPSMSTRAVDGDWIVQLDLGSPQVALLPTDRSNEEQQPHAVQLKAPTGEATFVRHLDAGHHHAMAIWSVEEKLYLGIHALQGDGRGQATSFLPAPFEENNATGWAIGNAMEVFVVGPYAISTATGELAAFSSEGDITRAYGPAIVTETQQQRFFTVDHTTYTESERIIGYSSQGLILVRLIDGSVAAYGNHGGIA